MDLLLRINYPYGQQTHHCRTPSWGCGKGKSLVLCKSFVLQDNGPLVQLMRWLWDENAHGIYPRDFSQIHGAEKSQLEAWNWSFIRTPQCCTGLLERTLQETGNKSETERKSWDCLPEARKKKHLILKGGVERKWKNPTSKRQLLENRTYTEKKPCPPEDYTSK